MITVTKIFTFDAAHKIPKHLGKCRFLHGHTYKLEVTVMRSAGDIDPNTGMVIDFGDLKEAVNPIVEMFDHSYINDILPVPTAENMLNWMAERLTLSLPGLCNMKLWETPTSYAEWFP